MLLRWVIVPPSGFFFLLKREVTLGICPNQLQFLSADLTTALVDSVNEAKTCRSIEPGPAVSGPGCHERAGKLTRIDASYRSRPDKIQAFVHYMRGIPRGYSHRHSACFSGSVGSTPIPASCKDHRHGAFNFPPDDPRRLVGGCGSRSTSHLVARGSPPRI